MENPAPLPPSVIRFGVFEADVRAGELRKSGARVRMQEQPFQILLMLLERPTQVVTRDEIRRKLWSGDIFVDFEHGVNSAVARLRDALGDSADSPRYIETLPRRGYRFIAAVEVTVVESPKKPNGNGNGHSNGSAIHNVEGHPPIALLPPAPDIRSTLSLPTSSVARRRPLRLWAAGLTILFLTILFGVHVASRPRHRLRETDSIVLAGFVNSTSDPVFDSTLRQALSVKLSESPFLSVVAEQRMRDTLRFMGRSPDERITSTTAREICQRLGSKAMISGQISQLADHYFIQLEAFSCGSGDSIAQAGAEAPSKAETLKALDAATAEIRGKLGESLGSIQKFDAPIEQATTTSLDALKAYSLAQMQRNRGDELGAIPLLQRAVELDPNFAMAYAVLGQVYANTGQNDLAAENTRIAFLSRDKVGDQEKFYISTHYYDNVTREFDKSIQTYELWQETYPRDVIPRINLNEFYGRRGEYDKALQEILQAQHLEPNRANIYEALMGDYVCLDRLADAKAAYAQSLERGFNGEGLQLKRYVVAFLENDTMTMQHLTKAAAGQRQENIFDALNAETTAYSGQLHAAEDFTRRALEISSRGGSHESGLVWEALEALNEAEYGRENRARVFASAAISTQKDHDTQIVAALAFARTGDAAHANSLISSIEQRYPTDTLVNTVWIPAIHAQLSLSHGDAAAALQSLQTATPFDLGEMEPLSLFVPFLRGQAYLKANRAKDAAAEFQKILSHPGIAAGYAWDALAHLELARALVSSGDVAGGRSAYRDFLTLWKNADSDLPVLQQAKLEYAHLHE